MTSCLRLLSILVTTPLTIFCFAHGSRRLSFLPIANYKPKSQVTDHCAIDLDQNMMEEYLSRASDESFEIAKNLYMRGGHSKSVAVVKLDEPLKQLLKKGTIIFGEKAVGGDLKSSSLLDVRPGLNTMKLRYSTSDEQFPHVTCQVGAIPGAKLGGCFPSVGNFSWWMKNELTGVDERVIAGYTYDPATENINERTLMGFSTNAFDRMFECINCPYADYLDYINYYGVYDYAHQYITAAFDGGPTKFLKGNNDFGVYGFEGRAQVIGKATVLLSLFMYVTREMEDAVDDCEKSCIACNDEPVHAWDESVAFYTGALEGVDGKGEGKLFHAVADELCILFRTCGESGDLSSGTARVNYAILDEGFVGQNNIFNGNCNAAKKNKDEVIRWMKVALIQGTLRSAYKVTNEEYSEVNEGEGAVFMAAIVPYVHKCDPNDADIIYAGLNVGSRGGTPYREIKAALERNYDCMGILCSEVGGLYDSNTYEYISDAAPCMDANIEADENKPKIESAAFQKSFGFFFLIPSLMFIISFIT